ncbi:major facilitator superfamily domain-containing protein [Roridomyces roridus]|uniref:Major facilitator superfamily domain-containing protein n=1 Tax=Roridomyces roridus TaxID=1738132 RepID=A0AAD7BDK1_9AGAR|nr:major facilitator superfamily domain-containing protein [Roridomyces roridus]
MPQTGTTTISSEAIELQSRTASASASSSPAVLQLAPPADSVPDGGYGWVVVLGCAVLTWLFAGSSYSWGIIQAALVKDGLSSSSTLSFVGSTTVACISGLALVNARIVRFLGARKMALLGVFFLGMGQVFSGFATENVGALFVTSGAITGIGTSLCFMVVSITPAQYFSKRRGLANGIVYAGGGLGGAVTSFAMNGLIESLGPAWTFKIFGVITLAAGLPAAWVIKERKTIRTTAFIEWSLFRDTRFITLFFAGAIGTFPLFVPPFFLPLYSNSLSLSAGTAAALLAAFNFSSALGRLGCGFASDVIGPVNVLFLALLLSAISMLALWPVSTTLAPLVVFAVINGAANGGFFATMPTVVGAVFGAARVSVAMGMIVTGWVGGYLMGAPIAGYLLNAYGGPESTLSAYHPAMFYAGSMAMGSAGLVSLLRLKTSTGLFSKV